MGVSAAFGWVLALVLGLGAGFLGGALLLHWYNRMQLVRSTQYILHRLKVVETDLHRMCEEQIVLREYLRRKGLLDDEDLAALRRELIDIPRQLEAERNELLAEGIDKEKAGRVIKDVPDTFH